MPAFGGLVATALGSVTGIVTVERADTAADGWRLWLEWLSAASPDNATEIQALETDRGRYLGYARVVGRRNADARLDEPIVSVPTQYTKKPLLRATPE